MTARQGQVLFYEVFGDDGCNWMAVSHTTDAVWVMRSAIS